MVTLREVFCEYVRRANALRSWRKGSSKQTAALQMLRIQVKLVRHFTKVTAGYRPGEARAYFEAGRSIANAADSGQMFFEAGRDNSNNADSEYTSGLSIVSTFLKRNSGGHDDLVSFAEIEIM